MCRCATILFGQFVRVSKKDFRRKKVHFLLLFFYWNNKKRNYEKMEKENFKKKPKKNNVFGGCEQNHFFCFSKNGICLKIDKHYLCSEGKERRAFSLQLSVFGNGTFL